MSNTRRSLFRKAALDAQRDQGIGQIVLVRPIGFGVLTALALSCSLLILAFLFLGEYTKRARIQGLLVPDSGLIRVSSPSSGLVEVRNVKEGQVVEAGQALFVLSNERKVGNSAGGVTSAGSAIENSLHSFRQSLIDDKRNQNILSNQQRKQIVANTRSLQSELAQLEQQLSNQADRVKSSEEQFTRWQNLSEQKFASDLTVQQRRDELLEQKGRLQAIEQSRIQIARQIGALESDLSQIDTRSAREQEQLKRSENEVEQAQINLQTQRKVIITAPVSGVATTLLADVGQMVGAQTLVSIVPRDAQLQAHLYAPSRSAGFVEVGQTVRLRYDAYPYQKFGQYMGVVQEVSRSPVSSQELPPSLPNSGLQSSGEGLYRIKVRLAQQGVNTYGKVQPLSAGMQLEADVLQDTRRIVEWMFESLFTMKGKW